LTCTNSNYSGKDNFAADREEARNMLRVYPPMAKLAQDNRRFLSRAVMWVAGRGVRQFLDIGSGLPTRANTHESAQGVDESCRVVYVDNDPLVVTHAQALLADPGAGVEAITGDLREPMGILGDPVVCKLIRPSEPACVVLAMVLHFFPFEEAREIASAVIRWLPPGSYAIISVGCGDEQTGGVLTSAYTAAPLYNHSPGQVAKFFGGLPLVEPGLVDVEEWRPARTAVQSAHQGGRILAGVGRKQK
jgi:SAM-dependent methyltransferase